MSASPPFHLPIHTHTQTRNRTRKYALIHPHSLTHSPTHLLTHAHTITYKELKEFEELFKLSPKRTQPRADAKADEKHHGGER